MAERSVWCLLVDRAGAAYKGLSVDKVRVPADADVADLRDALTARYADSALKGVAPNDLRVYADKSTFEATTADVPTHLDPRDDIAEEYGAKDALMYVEVPDGAARDVATRAASNHSATRRKRWRELNDVLDEHNKKAKTSTEDVGASTTKDSGVRWDDVKSVLYYERYKQRRKPIPDDKFAFLLEYLKYASHAMGGLTDASNEAKRRHFVAPVLVMLCSLFDDAKLEVKEAEEGDGVQVERQFEFILTRGKKTKMCIVEAKKNDFERGKARALVGCEAVANREDLHVVYSLVTDFTMWQLFRSGEDSIVMDFSALGVRSDVLQVESMRDVCEMIYGALSDQDEDRETEQLGGITAHK